KSAGPIDRQRSVSRCDGHRSDAVVLHSLRRMTLGPLGLRARASNWHWSGEPTADVLAGRDPGPVLVEPAMELARGIEVGLGAGIRGDVETGVGGRMVGGGFAGEGGVDDRAEARRLVALAHLLSFSELREDLAAEQLEALIAVPVPGAAGRAGEDDRVDAVLLMAAEILPD